jgi:hypothetical protein
MAAAPCAANDELSSRAEPRSPALCNQSDESYHLWPLRGLLQRHVRRKNIGFRTQEALFYERRLSPCIIVLSPRRLGPFSCSSGYAPLQAAL